tara:strand:- start:299 stop:511 length:213 start_codon:yes stop_codon:yes gene_type:complete
MDLTLKQWMVVLVEVVVDTHIHLVKEQRIKDMMVVMVLLVATEVVAVVVLEVLVILLVHQMTKQEMVVLD